MNTPDPLPDLTQRREQARQVKTFGTYMHAVLRGDVAQSADPGVALIHRAAVEAHSTSNASAVLADSVQYVELIDRATLRRIPGALTAPAYSTLPTPDDVPLGEFIGEGQPIPLGRLTLGGPIIEPAKIAVEVVFTRELAFATNSRATDFIQRAVTRAVRRSEDRLMLDSEAAVATVRPAGWAYGLSAVGGGSPSQLKADFEQLHLEVSDGAGETLSWIMSGRVAVHLALSDDPIFEHLGPNGGTLMGLPALASAAAGNRVFLVDGAKIVFWDEGLDVEKSPHAAIMMSDAPSSPANLVSAFQTNSVALRAIRRLSWAKLSGDAVGFLEITDLSGSPA